MDSAALRFEPPIQHMRRPETESHATLDSTSTPHPNRKPRHSRLDVDFAAKHASTPLSIHYRLCPRAGSTSPPLPNTHSPRHPRFNIYSAPKPKANPPQIQNRLLPRTGSTSTPHPDYSDSRHSQCNIDFAPEPAAASLPIQHRPWP